MLKKCLSVLLAVILMISALTVLPVTINAKEVDFAVDGADVELAKVGFSIRTSYPGTDNYYYVPRSAANPFAVDSNGGNCTWYAWGRVYEASGSYPNLPKGNANTWYGSASCAKGSSPRPGAVICGNAGDYGHVAFVEKVYADGVHFDYSESNWGGARFNYKEYKTTTNFGGFQGFLYPFDGGSSLDFTTVYMGEHFYANIIHSQSGKAVVAEGDNAGDNVVLSTLDGNLQYKWEFINTGDNSYVIVNNHSGKFLDVSGGNFENGTNILVWDGKWEDNQKWYFKAVGNGYSLVPKCATNSALDIENGSVFDGANIQLWNSNNTSAQIFTLNYLPSFVAQNLGKNFHANIIQYNSDNAIAAVGDNAGDNVELQTLDGKLLHKWEFVRQADWSYKIYNNHSGKCLDVRNVSSENGANIQVYDAHDTNAQLWYFKAVGNGYSLVPKCALNSCIDIQDGNISSGRNIQLFQQNSSDAQIFRLNYLPSFVAQNLGKHFFANIVHLESNKPIVAVGDNNGDNVELGEFSGAIIKKWEFIRQNDWSYIIINNHSGKALDVNGGYSENMSNIQVWSSNNSSAQRWYIKEVGNGYSLVPKCALESALDLENGLAENGTNISLHKQNSSSAQIYYFNLQPSDIALDVGESFDAYIVHNASGFAVSYNAVGNTIVQPNKNKDEQKWHFERQKDMSYIITNHIVDIDSDLYMSVDKQYNHDGANVQIDSANGLNGQRWYIIKNGSGYSLIPKCAVNRAMDLAGGNTDNGNIEIWELVHDNPNQIFEINVIEPITYTLGDVDFDGNIDIRDATWIQRSAADIEIPFTISKTTADIDGDNNITVMDATQIQYYLANMKNLYHIGEKI